MLSGPKQARMMKEFEAEILATLNNDCHNEEALADQETFKQQTVSLINKSRLLAILSVMLALNWSLLIVMMFCQRRWIRLCSTLRI